MAEAVRYVEVGVFKNPKSNSNFSFLYSDLELAVVNVSPISSLALFVLV
jgi:hypothetical protein